MNKKELRKLLMEFSMKMHKYDEKYETDDDIDCIWLLVTNWLQNPTNEE